MAVYNLVSLDTAAKQLVETTLAFDTSTGQLTVPITPLNDQDAVSKSYVDAVAGDTVTWLTLQGKPTEFNPAPHTHEMSDINGLDTTLEGFIDITDIVTSSSGVADAGKVVALNGVGMIDPSMLNISSMTYLGTVDPTTEEAPPTPNAGDTYISSTTGTALASWGLTEDVNQGDMLIWNGASWDAVGQDIDLSVYLLKAGDTMTGELIINKPQSSLQYGPAAQPSVMQLYSAPDFSYSGFVPATADGAAFETASRLSFATGVDGTTRGWYIGSHTSPNNRIATVATANAAYVLKAGDTMTGILRLINGSSVSPGLQFANANNGIYWVSNSGAGFTANGVTMGWLDAATTITAATDIITAKKGDARYLQLSGGNMTGGITMGSFGAPISGDIRIFSPAPYLHFYETDVATANERGWSIGMAGGTLLFGTRNDDTSTKKNWFTLAQTGEFSNSPGGAFVGIGNGLTPSSTNLPAIRAQRSSGSTQYIGLDGGDSGSVYVWADTSVTSGKSVTFENITGGVAKEYIFRVDGTNVAIIEGANNTATYNDTVMTRRKGDARYLQSGAGASITGLTVDSNVPFVDLVEADGNAAWNKTRFIRDGNNFNLQTRGTAHVSTDYKIEYDSAGANIHRWYTANTEEMKLEDGGLTVTNNITAGGTVTVNNSTIYINGGTNPQLRLQDTSGQVTAMFYADLGTLAYIRSYQSAASSNYTNYAFRYNGATGGGDVLRMTDGDARYVSFRGKASSETETYAIDGRYNIYANHSSNIILRLYDGSDDSIKFTFNDDGSLDLVSGGSINGTSAGVYQIRFSPGSGNSFLVLTSGGSVTHAIPASDITSPDTASSARSIMTRTMCDNRYLNSTGAYNAIGSTCFVTFRDSVAVVGGDTVAGSTIKLTQANGNPGTQNLPGTWMACGTAANQTDNRGATAARRIA